MEQLIRPVKIGVKNYLLAGSHRGGERAAIIYSLLGTCKLQGIDPYTWLYDVLHRISVQPEKKLAELLPQRWKPLWKKMLRHKPDKETINPSASEEQEH